MEEQYDPNRMLQELLSLIVIFCNTLWKSRELLDTIVLSNMET